MQIASFSSISAAGPGSDGAASRNSSYSGPGMSSALGAASTICTYDMSEDTSCLSSRTVSANSESKIKTLAPEWFRM